MDLCRVNLFLLLCSVSLADTDDRCPKTFTLQNGQVRFQSRLGVTAIFQCNPGYVLRGSNVSHCQTDGHWSAPSPFCDPEGQRCAGSEIETLTSYPGQFMNISCSAVNASNLFWTTDKNLSLTSYNINGTLVLSTNNEGTYICLSYNKTSATIIRTVKVILFRGKSMRMRSSACRLTFKDNRTSVTRSVGSQLSLSCDVNSSAANVSWFKIDKNDKILQNSEMHLNFSSLTQEDEGNYSCFVYDLHEPECSATKWIYVKVHNPIFLLPNKSCGQPIKWRSKRVIDGSRAAPLSAPWMGMISLGREPPFCGCSLISSQWIITAAHCFKVVNKEVTTMMSQEEIQKRVRVKFGKQQRRIEKGEIVRGVKTMIFYPKYKPISSSQNIASEHDIALAKLDVPLVFQSNVLPICLPPPGFVDSIPAGSLGVVTGWGRVSVWDSVMAITLQEAYLPLVNNSSCQSTTDYIITENMLCAGYAESNRPDTCFGDSGGPFIMQRQDSWFLIGIVSWGEGCSSPMKFGIYTNVEKYVPWIQSVLDIDVNS